MGNGQTDDENWKKVIIFVVNTSQDTHWKKVIIFVVNTSQDTPNRQQYFI